MRESTLLDLAESLYPSFSDLLYSLERKGVYVSIPELERIEGEATASIHQSTKALDTFSGLSRNWNSGAEVAEFLYDQLGLPELPEEARSPRFWNKERITAHEALEWFHRHFPERRPEIDTLRQYRRGCRALNYATDLKERARATKYPGLGTIHPTIGTYSDSAAGRDRTGTNTGRLSISNPPLQQMPRDKRRDPFRVRKAFVAPPGQRFCAVDLETLEVRILAHLFIKLFGDDSLKRLCLGGDFHGRIAHKVFSQLWPRFADHVGGWDKVAPNEIKDHPDAQIRWCRDQVKACVYGVNYGKGAKAFGATLWTLAGDPIGTEAAQAIMDGIFADIPSLPRYQAWVRATIAEKGGMWSLLGRWRPLDKDNRGWRQGLNQPLQAGGSEVAMAWMLSVRELDLRCQIHDELLLLADEDKADATVKLVERAAFHVGEKLGLECPIGAKGGHSESWDGAK